AKGNYEKTGAEKAAEVEGGRLVGRVSLVTDVVSFFFQAEDGIRDGYQSLVGSEMCIRDRETTSPGVPHSPRSFSSRLRGSA
ncbi:hypothetical protein, partial [Microbacterium proteolyticum]|uniref:hypothetical protein n=1 Tax=Microbacterium proteolyticum TaxID=1572644 RepID=UPI001FABCCA1